MPRYPEQNGFQICSCQGFFPSSPVKVKLYGKVPYLVPNILHSGEILGKDWILEFYDVWVCQLDVVAAIVAILVVVNLQLWLFNVARKVINISVDFFR